MPKTKIKHIAIKAFMVITKVHKNQGGDYRELIKKMQQEARGLLFDKMMYEVNDALTSILASCDADGKEAIPKIKQYIHRINQSLGSAKSLASSKGDKRFNISLILQNLIAVFKEHFKNAKMACLISDIKAPVRGEQFKFEELMFYTLISLFLSVSENGDSEMLIELRQKDQDAMITILKDYFVFTAETVDHISKIYDFSDFKGMLQITPQGMGVEIIIRLPLQFSASDLGINKSSHTVQNIKVESVIKKQPYIQSIK